MNRWIKINQLIWNTSCDEDCRFREACDEYEAITEVTLCDLMCNKMDEERRKEYED